MDERTLKLMKLIEHWAEHNDEHGQRFNESVAQAEDMGLKDVSNEMKEAYLKTLEVSRHLRNALTRLKEGG
jgi:hypothetical protein